MIELILLIILFIINYNLQCISTGGVKKNNSNNSKNAYVWLLMMGDSYLPGVFTSVYSVKRTKTNFNLVVMVTPDISNNARNILRKLTPHVIEVPYIKFDTNPLKTQHQQEMYSRWISSSYTKWNILKLPYKKVLFLDADVIVLKNIDHLFELNTPAAPFANPYAEPLGTIKNYYTGKKDKDGYLLHGEKIQPSDIKKSFYQNGTLINATAVLLTPDVKEYEEFMTHFKNTQPFGVNTNYSASDEQSLVYFYSIIKNKQWINIHQRYNYINWKTGYLSEGDVPYIIHYFSVEKPWVMPYDKWPDVISWYKMAAEAIKKTKIKPEDIKLSTDNISKAVKAEDTYLSDILKLA